MLAALVPTRIQRSTGRAWRLLANPVERVERGEQTAFFYDSLYATYNHPQLGRGVLAAPLFHMKTFES
jgi:hypothetical protein